VWTDRKMRELRQLGRWKWPIGLLDACSVVDTAAGVDWSLHIQ
jgi:hypothetical protein